jgi:TonB family protein
MHRSTWMITALLFMVSGMVASRASGGVKPMQDAQQPGTNASAKSGGQETATPPSKSDSDSRPNPDASGVYHSGKGVTPPQLIYSVDPEFTDQARKKKLSGTCIVGMVVDSKGNPQDVHVVKSIAEDVSPKLRSVAQGLDEKAVEGVRQYKFKPATYQGKAVPYETTVEVAFRIY